MKMKTISLLLLVSALAAISTVASVFNTEETSDVVCIQKEQPLLATMHLDMTPLVDSRWTWKTILDSSYSFNAARMQQAGNSKPYHESVDAWLRCNGYYSEFNFRYIVQRGDCLSKLAKRFDCSVEKLQWHNLMGKSTVIYAGETITIPMYQKY
jgi:hypothetical protein